MAIWVCGRCEGRFADVESMTEHEKDVHGDHARAEPRWPASSPVKPLGPETPVADAESLRHRTAGAFRETVTPEEARAEAHPTGMTSKRAPPKGRGRSPES